MGPFTSFRVTMEVGPHYRVSLDSWRFLSALATAMNIAGFQYGLRRAVRRVYCASSMPAEETPRQKKQASKPCSSDSKPW